MIKSLLFSTSIILAYIMPFVVMIESMWWKTGIPWLSIGFYLMIVIFATVFKERPIVRAYLQFKSPEELLKMYFQPWLWYERLINFDKLDKDGDFH